MKKALILDIIANFFILLFLYTGIMKIIDHHRFDWALHKSPLLYGVAPILSYLVPIGELLIVMGLMLPRTRRLGLISSLCLMSIFTIYIGYMLYFRMDRPCTCGGIISYMNWHQHFYFNTAATLLALYGVLMHPKRTDLDTKRSNAMDTTKYPMHI